VRPLLLVLLLVLVVVVVLRERKMKDSGQSVTRLFALLRVCDHQPHDAFRRHLTVRYKRQRPDEIAVRYAHMKTK